MSSALLLTQEHSATRGGLGRAAGRTTTASACSAVSRESAMAARSRTIVTEHRPNNSSPVCKATGGMLGTGRGCTSSAGAHRAAGDRVALAADGQPCDRCVDQQRHCLQQVHQEVCCNGRHGHALQHGDCAVAARRDTGRHARRLHTGRMTNVSPLDGRGQVYHPAASDSMLWQLSLCTLLLWQRRAGTRSHGATT